MAQPPSASWNDLPPELMDKKILTMRRESMRADAKQRRMDKIIAEFWDSVWRARPRVFHRRLPQVPR